MPASETAPAYDLLVAGSGIAGLGAALAAAEHAGRDGARIALLTGGALVSGCTAWAQGGMAAAVGGDDSADLHLADTVAAGRGLCDPEAARVLVDGAAAVVERLARWGVRFDTDAAGRIALGREAAHSRARIVHAGGDATGAVIARALAARLRSEPVTVLEHLRVVDLLVDGDRCAGVVVVDATGATRPIPASATLLATGGAGALWRNTTNPDTATGDGVALAHLAGAAVDGMEFMQFHPTALRIDGAPCRLLSEALRGEGAHVVDDAGRRFLFDTDARGELAGRDVVAGAIAAELERSGRANAWLDATHLGDRVAERFPTVQRSCAEHGLDLRRDRIPIAPAAHYLIGGVRTDRDGATTLGGLYAAGEVASTGVHGANRLASNSLLEGAVFGPRAAVAALRRHAEDPAPPAGAPRARTTATDPRLEAERDALRAAMWSGCGIVRDAESLRTARAAAEHAREVATSSPSVQARALELSATTALLACRAAEQRTESCGAHVRRDHAHTDALHGEPAVHRERRPL